MLLGGENRRRSNLAIFTYPSSGSPMHDLMVHISKPLSAGNPKDRNGGLGLNLLDYEHCDRKGEILYAVVGDSMPVSQSQEEARIGTLDHAIKKFGNTPDAVEFILCVDTICGKDSHPLSRQWVCSYWYKEVDSRGKRAVLKDMGILAMHLASVESVTEITEYEIEDEIMAVGLRDRDAQLTTLAHAMKVLGNVEDAAAFVLCLDAICGNDCSPRDHQRTAAFYYNEIKYRGADVVLKEISLLATQYASLKPKPAAKTAETDQVIAENGHSNSNGVLPSQNGYYPCLGERLIKQELKPLIRMIRGHRRTVVFDDDEPAEWLPEPELNDVTIDDSDDDSAPEEPTAQLDEGGLGITMSSLNRVLICGRLDPEFTEEDLPGEEAQELAEYLRRAFASGVGIKEIWEEINSRLKITFPISIGTNLPKAFFPSNRTTGRTNLMAIERRPRFASLANIELQKFTREVLEAILDDCYRDVQMMALRSNATYRRFHTAIRRATDTKDVGKMTITVISASFLRPLVNRTGGCDG